MAEDDEQFLVHLVNPTGGATLDIGSTVRVTIISSDDAFGVIELDPGSQSIVTTEKEETFNNFSVTVRPTFRQTCQV